MYAIALRSEVCGVRLREVRDEFIAPAFHLVPCEREPSFRPDLFMVLALASAVYAGLKSVEAVLLQHRIHGFELQAFSVYRKRLQHLVRCPAFACLVALHFCRHLRIQQRLFSSPMHVHRCLQW